MTDLRARLTDALRDKWGATPRPTPTEDIFMLMVDALLSLPHIAIADRDTLNNLLELHKPTIWNSAPFSRDGTTDDLCCLTCDRLGDRHTWTTPSWPCQTRQLLDTLANAEEKHD